MAFWRIRTTMDERPVQATPVGKGHVDPDHDDRVGASLTALPLGAAAPGPNTTTLGPFTEVPGWMPVGEGDGFPAASAGPAVDDVGDGSSAEAPARRRMPLGERDGFAEAEVGLAEGGSADASFADMPVSPQMSAGSELDGTAEECWAEVPVLSRMPGGGRVIPAAAQTDEPTRVLLLSARLRAVPWRLPELLAELLRADSARWVYSGAAGRAGETRPLDPAQLTVPVGPRQAVRLRRADRPFTPVEAARAAAFV
ncbi:hypothetical protein C1I98_31465, partial [Spongiactinospora gelatinilytica]